jgi:hypothetical protein
MSEKTASDTSPSMGVISCNCGGVSLVLPNAQPRFRCGCCCTDCLQRAYIAANGRPPAAVRNLEAPVDLLYVDSQIMRPSPATLAKLTVFKLNTADAPNLNLRATCCGTVLCTQHQGFHAPHTLATFNNLRPFLQCDFDMLPESQLNVWTIDWPPEKSAALAVKEESTQGRALPQLFDVKTVLRERAITNFISVMQKAVSIKPAGSISYTELCAGMGVEVETSFFAESRAHLSGEAP